MRIDGGPSLAEIRLSITEGTIVTFFNKSGERLRGRVLDAKLDPGIGRVSLVLEEEKNRLIWFARYRFGSIRCATGDIVTWNLRRNEIQNISDGSQWQKCAGE